VSSIKTNTLVLDVINRKLLCNERIVSIGGKRTAIYVQCLISCFLQNKQLTKTALSVALASDEPNLDLDRTAIKRLVESADKALRDASGINQQRITHRPRSLTTGPWHLSVLQHEQWALQGAQFDQPSLELDPLLTLCGDAARSCALANSMVVIDTQIQSGKYNEAVQLLALQLQSPDLSDESKCLLNLRSVHALRSTANTTNLSMHLADLEQRANTLPRRLQAYFLGELAMFGARDVFNQSPVRGALDIDFLLLRQRLDASPNTSSQWEWCNLKALTLRRRIEKQIQSNAAGELVDALVQELLRQYSSAYFWTLISKTPYYGQSVACNFAYSLYWLYSRQLYPKLDTSIAWFKLAHTMVDKFDLPQDSAWDFLMLGDIYLKSKEARRLVKSDPLAWPEQINPANEIFYLRALDLATTFGGPRQQITALNQNADFLQQAGAHSRKLSFIKKRDALISKHPVVFAEMVKDGFMLA
jgi:hypothetical protein